MHRASVTSGGGFVLLMGTEVDNAGSITTAKGQTMLAAGDDFILRAGYGTDGNQYSTTRGNEVAPVLCSGSSSGAVDQHRAGAGAAGRHHAGGPYRSSRTASSSRPPRSISAAPSTCSTPASDATGSVKLTGNSFSLILPETADAAALVAGIDPSATAFNSQRDALIAARSKRQSAGDRPVR